MVDHVTFACSRVLGTHNYRGHGREHRAVNREYEPCTRNALHATVFTRPEQSAKSDPHIGSYKRQTAPSRNRQ